MLHINLLLLFFIFLIVLGALLLLIFIVQRNKFNYLNIKINAAEKEIDVLLSEKKNIITSICDKVTESIDKDLLKGIDRIEGDFDSITLSNKLYDMEKELLNTLSYKASFVPGDEISILIEKLKSVSGDSLSMETYYNDQVSLLNGLQNKFLSRIVGRITGNHKKELFMHKEEEVFEILKDK